MHNMAVTWASYILITLIWMMLLSQPYIVRVFNLMSILSKILHSVNASHCNIHIVKERDCHSMLALDVNHELQKWAI